MSQQAPSRPSALRSTGITRLHRYYEPFRHPTRPGLSLAGFQLTVTRRHRRGFPCCVTLPCIDMPSPLPRRDQETDVVLGVSRRRPSPSSRWVGSHIRSFEACSAFTQITACQLAEPPSGPFSSEASTILLPPSPLRLLPAGTTVAGRELHPLKTHAFSRRTRRGTRTWLCGA